MSFISPSVFVVATWLAAICGGVGVAAAFISAIVGYQLTEKSLKDSDVKIAEATARQTEAELKLEQLRKFAGPRSINVEAFMKALEGKPKGHVQIWYLPDLSDGWSFSFQIQVALGQAGWEVDDPVEIPAPDPNNIMLRNMPRAMAAGGSPSGVTIVGTDPPGTSTTPVEGTPCHSLWDAFMKGMKGGFFLLRGAGGSQFMPVPTGMVRIVVAAKDEPIFPDPPPQAIAPANPK